MTESQPTYSAIIPIRDERDSVLGLHAALASVLDRLQAGYEIIFVDDASADGGAELLEEIRPTCPHLKIIRLNRPYGMATALQAGFDLSRGRILVTLDGDFQNDPEDIPLLLRKMEEGYDMVCGWRRHRQDPWIKKAPSLVANFTRRLVTGEKIHDAGCTLRVFKKEVVKNIYLSGGLHRFFTALVSKQGYRVAEIPVRHHWRRFGRSKFGTFRRILQGAVDLWRVRRMDLSQPMKPVSPYEIKEIL